MPRKFFGRWIAAASFITFGLAVGIPYYNIGFFYDYFQREFHWSRADITLGFPLAAPSVSGEPNPRSPSQWRERTCR